MNYKMSLLLVAVMLLYGCTGMNFNTATLLNSDLRINKGEVKESINKAIERNNSLVSILLSSDKKSKRSIGKVSNSDRLIINNARARQAIMFEKAKRTITDGYATPKGMLNYGTCLWIVMLILK